MSELRLIEQKVKGKNHGVITRLYSPGDLGNRLKPFVFLDFISGEISESFGFKIHAHSGIATLTYQLDVDVAYIDTEGTEGVLKAKGVEWMQAGGGAWHQGTLLNGGKVTGFQLWLALPEGIEDGPSYSQYVAPDEVPEANGVKVLLGEYQGLKSPINAPYSINYFDVSLKNGDIFKYDIPSTHQVAWAFVYAGSAEVNHQESFQEVIVFSKSGEAVEFSATTDCRILVGSAEEHPYPLITGYGSVHTNSDSLRKSEQKIAAIGQRLKQEGKLD